MKLEEILHPAVSNKHLFDIQQAQYRKKSLIVLEIPLLFETNWYKKCDYVLLVSCQPEIQYARVMARPGMTDDKFKALQTRQWSEANKKKLAHFVLDTSFGRVHTFKQLKHLLRRPCLNPMRKN